MMEAYFSDKNVKIYHGDFHDVLPTLSNVDLIATSPPYNVGMEYEERLDWRTYYHQMFKFIQYSLNSLRSGGILAVNLPKEVKLTKDQIEKNGKRVEKISNNFEHLCEEIGFLSRESIVWAKGSEGQPITPDYRKGSDNNIYLRSCCEIISLHSKDRYYWDGGTGRRGSEVVPWKDETKDVWWIPTIRRTGHPCPWPGEIPKRLITLFTANRKHIPIVVDPFMGSGITLEEAVKLGRGAIGIDKEEKHCELAANKLRQKNLFN